MYRTILSILFALMVSNSLNLDTQVLKVEGKIRENNEDQIALVQFEKPITDIFYFYFNGFKIISKENPKNEYRIRANMCREDKSKGDQIWLECPLNTTSVPYGKFDIISFYFLDLVDYTYKEFEFQNYEKVEIDILKDELSEVYLIDLYKWSGGVILHFNKDADLIDMEKLEYLILYDPDMGNLVPKLDCISQGKTDIICYADFSRAYHGDRRIVRNIRYGDSYIKAKKYIYFYP